MSEPVHKVMQIANSLNPCCNGIYSMRLELKNIFGRGFVLILVVMEYTQ